MRLFKVDLEHETDLILVGGLADLYPKDIARYILIVMGTDGDIRVSGDACCLYHDLQAVRTAADVSLATLTPCASERG